MICPNCGKDVEGVWEDIGIGSYEYWGAKGFDSRMSFLCESCGEELETEQSYQDHISDQGEL